MLWEWPNGGKQVFILDLDGTLMPSARVDDDCFWRAVFDCYGKKVRRGVLQDFKHVTDSGILSEWCDHELGRQPSPEEVLQIRQRFLDLLKAAWKREPEHFRPFPGVEAWLGAVQASDRVFTGIATGGWGHSARLKLELAGLDRFDLPLASSDEAVPRSEIMRIAARKTLRGRLLDAASFTYVGDGPWDLQASRELGWNFVGIAGGKRAELLREAGADHIQADFTKA